MELRLAWNGEFALDYSVGTNYKWKIWVMWHEKILTYMLVLKLEKEDNEPSHVGSPWELKIKEMDSLPEPPGERNFNNNWERTILELGTKEM